MIKRKEKTYRLNFLRILATSLIPIFGLVFSCFLVFYKFKKADVNLLDLTSLVLFLTYTTGIYLFIFFNHLPTARQTRLEVTNKEIFIIQNGKKIKIIPDQIEEISECSTMRLPWSSLKLWRIKTVEEKFNVTSLIISPREFERYFWNKIRSKTKVFPLI
jgi:hypothetical protein